MRRFSFIISAAIFSISLASCATKDTRPYTREKVTYGGKGFEVDVSKFASTTPSRKSLLIIPPTFGATSIDQSYARQFCESGYDVYILEYWTGMDEESTELELHQRLFERGQKAISLVLDQINSPFIGILGTSVGALHAEVAAAQQDRLKAVFIIAGGAPIAEVIVTSDQTAMKKLKEERKARYHFNNDVEYLRALEKAFKLEPLKLGDKFKEKRRGMAVAQGDQTVPNKTQQQLLEGWKPNLTLTFESSHTWTVIKTYFSEKGEILGFFDEAATRAGVSPYEK